MNIVDKYDPNNDPLNLDNMNNKMHYNYLFEVNVKYFHPELAKLEQLTKGN